MSDNEQAVNRNKQTIVRHALIGLAAVSVCAGGYFAYTQATSDTVISDPIEDISPERLAVDPVMFDDPIPVGSELPPANPLIDNIDAPGDGALRVMPPMSPPLDVFIDNEPVTIEAPIVDEMPEDNTVNMDPDVIIADIDIVEPEMAAELEQEISKIEEAMESDVISEPEFGRYDPDLDSDEAVNRSSVQVVLEKERQARVNERALRIEQDRLKRLVE